MEKTNGLEIDSPKTQKSEPEWVSIIFPSNFNTMKLCDPKVYSTKKKAGNYTARNAHIGLITFWSQTNRGRL